MTVIIFVGVTVGFGVGDGDETESVKAIWILGRCVTIAVDVSIGELIWGSTHETIQNNAITSPAKLANLRNGIALRRSNFKAAKDLEKISFSTAI